MLHVCVHWYGLWCLFYLIVRGNPVWRRSAGNSGIPSVRPLEEERKDYCKCSLLSARDVLCLLVSAKFYIIIEDVLTVSDLHYVPCVQSQRYRVQNRSLCSCPCHRAGSYRLRECGWLCRASRCKRVLYTQHLTTPIVVLLVNIKIATGCGLSFFMYKKFTSSFTMFKSNFWTTYIIGVSILEGGHMISIARARGPTFVFRTGPWYRHTRQKWYTWPNWDATKTQPPFILQFYSPELHTSLIGFAGIHTLSTFIQVM